MNQSSSLTTTARTLSENPPTQRRFSAFEAMLSLQSFEQMIYFFSFFGADTLMILGKVSWVIRGASRLYCATAWNLDTKFRGWFHSLEQLQLALHQSGAIISGSQVLQFFERSYYRGSDMDIFVRIGGFDILFNWLTRDGWLPSLADYSDEALVEYPAFDVRYLAESCITQGSREGTVLRTFSFSKLGLNIDDYPTTTLKLQVVVVDVNPLDHVLFSFHSTAVMNFITSTCAVSLFPKSTLTDHVSYVAKANPLTDQDEAWIQKYEGRGFNVRSGKDRYRYIRFLSGYRHVCDSQSWTITFPKQDLGEGVYKNINLQTKFEVITRSQRTFPGDAYLRVVEPFVWKIHSEIYQPNWFDVTDSDEADEGSSSGEDSSSDEDSSSGGD